MSYGYGYGQVGMWVQQLQQVQWQQQQKQQQLQQQQQQQQQQQLQQQLQQQREREEEQRVAAAKAALEAKLIGYEGGFPQARLPLFKKSSKGLAQAVGVVSAEHVPVPKEKMQVAKDAVVLLLNGQPVQDMQRDGLTYWPAELVEGAAADSFEVLMEAPTLLYRTNAEAQAQKEQQIRDAEKKIADAKDTLAELQQALTRSEAACNETVKAAGDSRSNAELSDIGAMVLEQQRIKAEIAKQQVTQTTQEKQLADLQKLADSQLQLTEHRITPRFHLQPGFNILSTAARNVYSSRADQPAQVVHVLKQSQHTVKQAQFGHSVADAK